MSLKNVRYTRLETEESEGEEDESPPTHVEVNSESAHVKGVSLLCIAVLESVPQSEFGLVLVILSGKRYSGTPHKGHP